MKLTPEWVAVILAGIAAAGAAFAGWLTYKTKKIYNAVNSERLLMMAELKRLRASLATLRGKRTTETKRRKL